MRLDPDFIEFIELFLENDVIVKWSVAGFR